MKTFFLLFLIVIAFSNCKIKNEDFNSKKIIVIKGLENKFQRRADMIVGFKFDSIHISDSVFECYVTDEMEYWNYLPISQKVNYTLQDLLHSNIVLIDTFTCYVNLPNRVEGNNLIMYTRTKDLLDGLVKYQSLCFSNGIDFMIEKDREDTSLHLLDRFNTDIAWFVYHEDMGKYAFEGVDSHKFFYLFSQENNHQDYNNIVDSLKVAYSKDTLLEPIVNHLINIFDSCN